MKMRKIAKYVTIDTVADLTRLCNHNFQWVECKLARTHKLQLFMAGAMLCMLASDAVLDARVQRLEKANKEGDQEM